jgi:hypothetical protein
MKTSARLALLVTVFAATQSLQASDGGNQPQPSMSPQLVHHVAHPFVWATVLGSLWYWKNPNNFIARRLPESVRNLFGHTRVEDVKHHDAKGLGKLLHVGEQAGNALVTSAMLANTAKIGLLIVDSATQGKLGTQKAINALNKCPLVKI